ncbi:hypothetical protein SUGI_0690590 [Cryptomeria japonica]|nr:hypothetical protein SUGI_0690590 [Cryptomeria japonica]
MAGVRQKSSLLGALILFTIARGAVSLGLPLQDGGADLLSLGELRSGGEHECVGPNFFVSAQQLPAAFGGQHLEFLAGRQHGYSEREDCEGAHHLCLLQCHWDLSRWTQIQSAAGQLLSPSLQEPSLEGFLPTLIFRRSIPRSRMSIKSWQKLLELSIHPSPNH